MRDEGLLSEANRQLTLCNACRFCEGVCAVFPAMELRSVFADGDVQYLANLCHDCGACLDVCPFSSPHEFSIDIPALMTQVRTETYEEFAWPRGFWRLLTSDTAPVAALVASLAFFTLVAIATGKSSRLLHIHREANSFYHIVPFLWIVVPAGLISAYVLVTLGIGMRAFVRDTDGGLRGLLDASAHRRALVDSLRLQNLRGGGGGCPYPTERSATRRVLHSCAFYGFLCTFLATVVAAFEQDILGMRPPYPIASAPVLLGTIGGVALILGCAGFLIVRFRYGQMRATDDMARLNRTFTTLLLASAVSGLLLLVLRSTRLMGPMLVIHLGVLGALFVTFPYGKFVHWIYRYAALVRFHLEADNS